MPTYGFIEKFSSQGEAFEKYQECLDLCSISSDQGELNLDDNNGNAETACIEKGKSILQSVIRRNTYALVRMLCAPSRPAEKTFKQITAILKEHFSPKPSEVVYCCKFHICTRQQGELVATFVSELQELAETCNFDNYLTDMLCDRF